MTGAVAMCRTGPFEPGEGRARLWVSWPKWGQLLPTIMQGIVGNNR